MIAIRRVARGENAIDFTKWWKRGLILSGVLLLISVGSLFTRGLNLGIDFEGGTSWEVTAPDVSVGQARDVLEPLGEGSAKIQVVSAPGGAQIIRVQSSVNDPETQTKVRDALAELGGTQASEVSVSTVGPSWGAEITRSAVRALVIFLVVLLIYLSIRLQWEMAVAAVVSLVHDVIICVGVYSVFQFEVTPGTVIAFLTILGFSIYDTVVVFDKVKENEPKVGLAGRMTYTEMVSLSMNEVLIRSINTTVTALLPVISILVVGSWILGAVTLEEFGVALFVGLLSGAYSSVFVAAPLLARVKERQKRYRTVRERLEAVRATGPAPAAGRAPAPATTAASAPVPTPGPSGPAPTPAGAIPPRPRKKGKRR